MNESKPELHKKDVLAKAITRLQPILGLTLQQLLAVLGTSRLEALEPSSDSGRRAAKLILIYRRLCACVGNNGADLRQWMTSHNHYFGSRPVDVIDTEEGLDQVLQYLNAQRF